MAEVDSNTLLKETDDFFLQGDFSDEEHFKEVLEIYKNLADKEENSDAMYKYAYILYDLYEVDENKKMREEAIKYFKMAIEKGNIDAMYSYAFILEDRDNNMEKAVKYYKMAADNGNKNAIEKFYGMISSGEVIVSNEEKIKYCKKAADNGNKDAISNYADMLYDGYGISENKQEAAEYYKIIVKDGNKNAIEKLYNMISNNIINATDKEKEKYYKIAIKNKNKDAIEKLNNVVSNIDTTVSDKEKAIYCKIAADEGNAEASNSYANMLYNGIEVKKNEKKAVKYYKIAANNGNKDAIERLYDMISNKIIDINSEEKVKYYKMAADKGNADAMNSYGYILQYGEGIPKNETEAVKYYKMAASKGNVNGMYNYAYMLYYGKGILKNKQEAAKYFKMAADKGDIYAMNSYAYMLDHGKGIPENKQEAAKYFKMAADLGNTSAMYSYAHMLRYSKGIPENKQEAAKYFKMAADNGNVDAMNNYAYMLLAIGDGASIDREEAVKYCKMAIDGKNIDFVLNEIPDKQVFTQLFEEYSKKIIKILGKNIEKYKIIKNKNGKIESIEIKCVNEEVQGKNQVITNRKINFDKDGNLISIIDTAIHKDTGKKLYEIGYNEEGERLITYFDPENSAELIMATIDENGIIEFNFDNGVNLETLKQKTNEILNSFSKNKSFDYVLSYLKYAPLQLMEKEEIEEDKIEFNTKCEDNFDNTLNIINSSLDKTNKDKLYICDFGYRGHDVQLLISNGEVTVINTGLRFDDKTEEIDVITEIKTKFAEKFPKKAEQLKITESVVIGQSTGNCVIASKLDAVEFLMKVRKHNQKRKRLIEINRRLIEIKNSKEYNKSEYKELMEENKKLTKKEDINNKLEEELEKEIEMAQSEIIEQFKIPEYLNDIDSYFKGEKKFEELQEKHFILSKKRNKTIAKLRNNYPKHFKNEDTDEYNNYYLSILYKKMICDILTKIDKERKEQQNSILQSTT